MIASARTPLVELRAVGKTYGAAAVLKNIDLAVEDGEFLVVLGPSGSGKTTILRLIGGFTEPTKGQILLDGAVINGMPINRRPFNTVFQDYALFPHMRVRENVAYGLRVRGLPAAEIATRTARVLDLVSLGSLADRYPAQLSGGQRQRVALARAIVCEPRLILLDEPLAALDVDLRRQMQVFLKDVQRQINTTFLFITHDQEEAITLADRICVMDHGAIKQIGSPRALYDRPTSPHVARFFGDNNLIPGRLVSRQGDRTVVSTTIGDLHALSDRSVALAEGAPVFVAIRPERIRLLSYGASLSSGDDEVIGLVEDVEFAGPLTHAVLAPSADPAMKLSVKMLSGDAPVAGERPYHARWSRADAWVVPS